MQEFEYESQTSKPRTEIAAALSLILAAFIAVLWTVFSAGIVKYSVRQTPQFLNFDRETGIKFIGYDNFESVPDVVFVGSSRVHRHINTLLLESRSEEFGCPKLTMYNFGRGGGSSSNTRFTLEWILAQNDKPRRIFVEPMGADQWSTVLSDQSAFYSPWNTYSIWQHRFKADATEEFGSSLLGDWEILKASSSTFFNLGWITRTLKQDVKPVDPFWFGYNGYAPLDQYLPADSRRVRTKVNFIKKTPDHFQNHFEASLEKYASMSLDERQTAILNDSHAMLSGLSKDDLKRIGIIYPPKLEMSQISGVPSITVRGVEIPVITSPVSSFNALNISSNWWDLGHFTEDAANRYSEYIAPSICSAIN